MTDGLVMGAATDVEKRRASLEALPLTSWWIGLGRPEFYAHLHKEEESRIRRKPSFGRDEKE